MIINLLQAEKHGKSTFLFSPDNRWRYFNSFRGCIRAEDSKNELIIVEIQNNRELDYFHRMLYGTSKAIAEYMHTSEEYEHVRKVYSINIVYFDLGQGKDYVYHGRTTFRGIHTDDELKLSARQRKQFMRENAGDLYPEYYVLRVDDFDKVATNPLDEWISFLKTGDIPDDVTAAGLPQAREVLRKDKMTREELASYNRHMEALRYQRSVIKTGIIEGEEKGMKEGMKKGLKEGLEEGRKEGREEGLKEGLEKGKAEGIKEGEINTARRMKSTSIPVETIMQITGLSAEEIDEL